ncbi:MAG TPA: hypothetical protein VFD58_00880 [Blastocatellia bacterium]|nr:hypothetical protein [Blastocatellia bacterium]
MKQQTTDRAAIVRAAYERLGRAMQEVIELPETPAEVERHLTTIASEIGNVCGYLDHLTLADQLKLSGEKLAAGLADPPRRGRRVKAG